MTLRISLHQFEVQHPKTAVKNNPLHAVEIKYAINIYKITYYLHNKNNFIRVRKNIPKLKKKLATSSNSKIY